MLAPASTPYAAAFEGVATLIPAHLGHLVHLAHLGLIYGSLPILALLLWAARPESVRLQVAGFAEQDRRIAALREAFEGHDDQTASVAVYLADPGPGAGYSRADSTSRTEAREYGRRGRTLRGTHKGVDR